MYRFIRGVGSAIDKTSHLYKILAQEEALSEVIELNAKRRLHRFLFTIGIFITAVILIITLITQLISVQLVTLYNPDTHDYSLKTQIAFTGNQYHPIEEIFGKDPDLSDDKKVITDALLFGDDISGATDQDKKLAKELYDIYQEAYNKAADKIPPMWVIYGISYCENSDGMNDWGIPLPVGSLSATPGTYGKPAANGQTYDLKYPFSTNSDGPFQLLSESTGLTTNNTFGVNPSEPKFSRLSYYGGFFRALNLFVDDKEASTLQQGLPAKLKDENKSLYYMLMATAYNSGQAGAAYRFPVSDESTYNAFKDTFEELTTNKNVGMNFRCMQGFGRGPGSNADVVEYLLNHNWKLCTLKGGSGAPTYYDDLKAQNVRSLPELSQLKPFTFTTMAGNRNFTRNNPASLSDDPILSGRSSMGASGYNQACLGYWDDNNQMLMFSNMSTLHYFVMVYVMGHRLEANVMHLNGFESTNLQDSGNQYSTANFANPSLREMTAPFDSNKKIPNPAYIGLTGPKPGKLQGKTVLLDPGHQQNVSYPSGTNCVPTSGTAFRINGVTYNEYKVNLDMAKVIGQILEEDGATVYYTRVSNDADEKILNNERGELANKLNADLMISIHCNSEGSGNVRGYEIHTPVSGYSSSSGGQDFGKILDKIYQDPNRNNGITFSQQYFGGHKRDVKQSDFTIFKYCNKPCILYEIAFVSNSQDAQVSITQAFYRSTALGMRDALERYFNV